MQLVRVIALLLIAVCQAATAQVGSSSGANEVARISNPQTGNDFLAAANLWNQALNGIRSPSVGEGNALLTMLGIIQGMRLANQAMEAHARSEGHPMKTMACIPEAVTSGQLVMVLKSDLERMPTILHLPFAVSSQAILRTRFSCG